jgi:HAD superfamily hydrolase (TIGR01509 family)
MEQSKFERLLDNMPDHAQSYVEAAKERDVIFDPEIIMELAGWPIANVVEEINSRYNANLVPTEFRTRKGEIFQERYLENIKPIDYVVDHLKASSGNVRIAVVSGGDRPDVQRTLEILGIDHLVEVLICAGDTKLGKPHPDPFLKAAELLGVDPAKCLVFEDGVPGVKAAEAAGMHWVRVDKLEFG